MGVVDREGEGVMVKEADRERSVDTLFVGLLEAPPLGDPVGALDRVLEGLAEGDLEADVLALGERVGGGERLEEGHMVMEKEGERVRGE